MSVKAYRVSKTSIKPWYLYGPVDQALKTTAQAEAVRVVPLSVEVHDQTIEVELWLNAEEAIVKPDDRGGYDSEDELNFPAQAMLAHNYQRTCGVLPPPREMYCDEQYSSIPNVQGVAILTGPGCSDFPDEFGACALYALMGSHDDDVEDD